MDCAAEMQPPEAPFSELEQQVVDFYGGRFRFLRFLASERDVNYLLHWERTPSPDGHAAAASETPMLKVILKVSNRGDSEALIKLQTQAMGFCHQRGCNVQEIMSRRGRTRIAPESGGCDDSDGVSSKIASISVGGCAFLARLIGFVDGEVLSALGGSEGRPADERLQGAAWAATGRALGKVSKALDEFYSSRTAGQSGGTDREANDQTRAGGARWEALDSEFEWNLSNMSTVVRKYLPYFDRGEVAPGSGPLLARKKRRVEELLSQHHDKCSCMRAVGASDGASSSERLTLTHHDCNDNNVVFTVASRPEGKDNEERSSPEVSVSILDFGDMGISYWFADAAIGYAYAPTTTTGDAFVAGWLESVRPGSDPGSSSGLPELIRDWARMRQVTSVCLSNFQAFKDPGNEYLQCSAAPLWRQLGVEA